MTAAVCAAWLPVVAGGAEPAPAEPPPRYEIAIDGENFTVDEGRLTKLDSRVRQGTSYRVAVRLAQRQRWVLGGVKFDYELGFAISNDPKTTVPTATLKHPLGFVAVITDLGGALPAADRATAIEQLVASMKKTLGETTADELVVSKPQRRKLGGNAVEAVTFSYLDAAGDGRMSAVYLVAGEKFTCSCLLQCQEENREEAVDLLKSTIGSMAPR
jgi:hypothetical protein